MYYNMPLRAIFQAPFLKIFCEQQRISQTAGNFAFLPFLSSLVCDKIGSLAVVPGGSIEKKGLFT